MSDFYNAKKMLGARKVQRILEALRVDTAVFARRYEDDNTRAGRALEPTPAQLNALRVHLKSRNPRTLELARDATGLRTASTIDRLTLALIKSGKLVIT